MQTLFFHVIQWITTLPYPKTRENKICNKHKIAPQNGHVEIWKNSKSEINNTYSERIWSYEPGPTWEVKGRQGEKITGPYPWVQCLSHHQVDTLTSHHLHHLLHPMMLKNSTINSKYSYKGITGKSQKFNKSDGIVLYFRVASSLCFKARKRAKPLKMKWFFILMKIKLISQARFCRSLILKVKGFGTRKIMAYR